MDNIEKKKRKRNPRDQANIVSLLTFGYTLGLFRKGLKKDIAEDDLYEVLDSCRSKRHGDEAEKRWTKKPSIFKLLFKNFGWQYLLIGAVDVFCTQLYSMLLPHCLSSLISYFQPNQNMISKTDAYYYAGIVVLLRFFQSMARQNVYIYEVILGIKVSAALKSLLYRKFLRLSPAALTGTNLGNLVTLLTKDIYSIEKNLWMIKDFNTFILQSVTISFLLWQKMGNSTFIGLALMFGTLPFQVYLSSLITKIRLNVGKCSDDRLHVMQETLSAIKIIKMYTWEKFFTGRIGLARKKEITAMCKMFYIEYILIAIGMITSKITFLVLILAYIWMGNKTSTEMIFYVLSLFQQLSMALGFMVPDNMGKMAELRAAFTRLNKVLQADELSSDEDGNINRGFITDTRTDVDYKSNSNQHNKTSIKNCITAINRKETDLHEYKMKENLSVADGIPKSNECTDEAFIKLQAVSVNILEKEVLKDINLSVGPGLTIVTGPVGSGKSSLLKLILKDYPKSSGRLNINGTISYASQEPWLFPSSIKQNILFGEQYDDLRYKEVLKVCALEYDLSMLDNGDETVLADRGQNLSKGQQSRINLARAVYRSCDIYLLDDSLTALDGHVQEFIFNECIRKFLADRVVLLVSQNAQQIGMADFLIVMNGGRIVSSGKPQGTDEGKLKALEQVISEKVLDEDDKKVELFGQQQQFVRKGVYQEEKKEGKVDPTVYKKYIQYGGGFIAFGVIVCLYTISQASESVADKELSKWIDLQQKVLDMQENSTTNSTEYQETATLKDNTLELYASLIIFKAIMGFVSYYSLLRLCRAASQNIHDAMSLRVVNADIAFFDNNFIGNILNRFSYDLNIIDESLQLVLPPMMIIMFASVGSAIVVATVNWILLIPCCTFFAVLVAMRMSYISIGRSLQRLVAATRSPLVGHINASLEGLTTVRAFKAEHILKNEFDRHQDLYNSASFTLQVSMTAFGFFMNFASTTFISLILIWFLFFDHDISAGSVGLVITQVFTMTEYIQYGINQWAQLENNMTSVERALEYTHIKQESAAGNEPKHWPRNGAVTYEKVSLRYKSSKEPVLKGVTFSVKPKQRIGIVGRTGAGKSSIISTLFRLYDCEGRIEIDEVDTKEVSLKYLRSKIAIIPQDPILFSGTIRDNIDPYRQYSDDRIWETISQVRIRKLIPALDMVIEDNGSNFSVGQKQLICLARAVMGKCKIVVLDEATANMDPATDKILYEVIDDVFRDCSVWTVAHRLQYIMNCDNVLVMDNGQLVEYDSPKVLLQNESSAFYNMCKEYKTD